MNKHQTVDTLYWHGRKCMVEGVLQGYDRLILAEYDGEYLSYAESIMEAVFEGIFTNSDMLNRFLFGMSGLDLDGVYLSELTRMIWNIVRHDVKGE